MSKHMRLPNGFGQISKLKNRRLRNPYRAMVTVGKTPEGRPICKLLKPKAYFQSYNEAYQALMEYNRNPYSLTEIITFKEVYERWYPEYEKDKAENTLKVFKQAWRLCEPAYDIELRNIKAWHIRQCMDSTTSPTLKSRIKMIFDRILNYAVQYDLIENNIARNFTPTIGDGETKNKQHSAFSKEELDLLWENKSDPLYRAILIQCYTGFRPEELCQLKKENINTDEWYITGGMKTEAGRNRVVPVVKKIREVVKEALNNDSDSFILNRDGRPLAYSYYYKHMKLAFPNHTPHDPRKTFVTMAKQAGVNDYAIKLIVGHAIQDITEKIYTERNIEWLRSEAEKM